MLCLKITPTSIIFVYMDKYKKKLFEDDFKITIEEENNRFFIEDKPEKLFKLLYELSKVYDLEVI